MTRDSVSSPKPAAVGSNAQGCRHLPHRRRPVALAAPLTPEPAAATVGLDSQ